ncbi:MAG: DNA polymerase IV [Candidatus Caldatribacteriota bacterium]
MKKIIHLDMDAFFAAVEMRDRPHLAKIPMAIGGGKRGVISTCNYKAREFGVRSGMSTVEAKKLCPHLTFIKPQFAKYKEVSQEVIGILERYTPLIEQVSIDEAYLDVTDSEECHRSATLLAQKIRNEIYMRTKLTASAGIAPNKLLAKIASDLNKPNGQFTIAPHEVEEFIKKIELKKIPGVGKVLNEKLLAHGLITCEDLQQLSLIELNDLCGKFGTNLFSYCRGIDDREVQTFYERKSVGVERTYLEDLTNLEEMKAKVAELIDELKKDLLKHSDRKIKNIHVKIKYNDFKVTTIERTLPFKDQHFFDLFEERYLQDLRPVRLLGVGVKLYPTDFEDQQLTLPLSV